LFLAFTPGTNVFVIIAASLVKTTARIVISGFVTLPRLPAAPQRDRNYATGISQRRGTWLASIERSKVLACGVTSRIGNVRFGFATSGKRIITISIGTQAGIAAANTFPSIV